MPDACRSLVTVHSDTTVSALLRSWCQPDAGTQVMTVSTPGHHAGVGYPSTEATRAACRLRIWTRKWHGPAGRHHRGRAGHSGPSRQQGQRAGQPYLLPAALQPKPVLSRSAASSQLHVCPVWTQKRVLRWWWSAARRPFLEPSLSTEHTAASSQPKVGSDRGEPSLKVAGITWLPEQGQRPFIWMVDGGLVGMLP